MEALWDKKVLGVKFNPKKNNLLSEWKLEDGNKMTTETILSWANTWRNQCGSSVPHFVVHEFGHALGLGHEHQCSKFWQNLYPFVYTELMEHDQAIGGIQEFGTHTSDLYYTSDLGPMSGEYDPQSIMHH